MKELTTRVQFEAELTRKLKETYRSKPEKPPEPYYNLLMRPYLDSRYIGRRVK